MTESKMWRKSW